MQIILFILYSRLLYFFSPSLQLLNVNYEKKYKPNSDNNIQLMHSFSVNIRICQPEKVMSTEAKPRWTSLSRVDKS